MNLEKNKKIFFLSFLGALSLVSAAYAIVPHTVRYLALVEEGYNYIPLTYKADPDTMNIHGARYRDIVDGAFISGEIDTFEHKNGPIFWPILSVAILAPFFWITGSVSGGIIASDFVFPILLFVSFFLVINALTKHRLFSLFSAFVLMLFPQLPLLIPPSSVGELRTLIFNFVPLPNDTITPQLMYLRREAFVPGAPFFVLCLFFLYRAITGGVKRNYIILAGIFYGLLFYLYFYFWVFATIFLGTLALCLLIMRRTSEVCLLASVAGVGLFVSFPFWVNQFALMSIPHYTELTARLGLEIGHDIKWFLWKTYLLFLAFAGASLWLCRKRSAPISGIFLAALSLAGIFALNANVLTGFAPQSDHWATRVFLVTNGIVVPSLVFYLYAYVRRHFGANIRHERMLLSLGAIILVALLSFGVLYNQVADARANAKKFSLPQSLREAHTWLNQNTLEDSVVLSPSFETNTDIPVYTHNRIFLPRAQSTLAPAEEILERLYITYAFFGISPVALYDMLGTERGVFYLFTATYASKAFDAYLRPEKYSHFTLPEDERIRIASTYARFIVPEKLPYRADYIFVGPKERNMFSQVKSFESFRKVYSSHGVEIYSMYEHI